MQEGLEAPPEEEQVGDADLLLGDDEDLSFASMFNSMRLEEADEPQPVPKSSTRAELDPVIPYGSFGQVLLCICNLIQHYNPNCAAAPSQLLNMSMYFVAVQHTQFYMPVSRDGGTLLFRIWTQIGSIHASLCLVVL